MIIRVDTRDPAAKFLLPLGSIEIRGGGSKYTFEKQSAIEKGDFVEFTFQPPGWAEQQHAKAKERVEAKDGGPAAK